MKIALINLKAEARRMLEGSTTDVQGALVTSKRLIEQIDETMDALERDGLQKFGNYDKLQEMRAAIEDYANYLQGLDHAGFNLLELIQ